MPSHLPHQEKSRTKPTGRSPAPSLSVPSQSALKELFCLSLEHWNLSSFCPKVFYLLPLHTLTGWSKNVNNSICANDRLIYTSSQRAPKLQTYRVKLPTDSPPWVASQYLQFNQSPYETCHGSVNDHLPTQVP